MRTMHTCTSTQRTVHSTAVDIIILQSSLQFCYRYQVPCSVSTSWPGYAIRSNLLLDDRHSADSASLAALRCKRTLLDYSTLCSCGTFALGILQHHPSLSVTAARTDCPLHSRAGGSQASKHHPKHTTAGRGETRRVPGVIRPHYRAVEHTPLEHTLFRIKLKEAVRAALRIHTVLYIRADTINRLFSTAAGCQHAIPRIRVTPSLCGGP